MFCADKRGWIRVFDSVRADSNSYVELWRAERDLTATWGDHGLLGMAVAPNYPTDPYIYVLMSVNRGTSPTDPRPVLPDPSVCPAGDGLAIDGSCDSTAHLVRLKGDDTHAVVDGVLYVGWCSNGLSHHIGNLAWARDGGLFVSGGDGSSYTVDVLAEFAACCVHHGTQRSSYRTGEGRAPLVMWRATGALKASGGHSGISTRMERLTDSHVMHVNSSVLTQRPMSSCCMSRRPSSRRQRHWCWGSTLS